MGLRDGLIGTRRAGRPRPAMCFVVSLLLGAGRVAGLAQAKWQSCRPQTAPSSRAARESMSGTSRATRRPRGAALSGAGVFLAPGVPSGRMLQMPSHRLGDAGRGLVRCVSERWPARQRLRRARDERALRVIARPVGRKYPGTRRARRRRCARPGLLRDAAGGIAGAWCLRAGRSFRPAGRTAGPVASRVAVGAGR